MKKKMSETNLVKYVPGQCSIVSWIKKRIRHNLNLLALIQGATGSGKTLSAISKCLEIDPNFSVNQIAFSFKEFMQIVNSDWFKKLEWKIIIFDEPQISISNRTWAGLTNKLMNYILSTFRHENVIVFFCCPYKDFLDSQSMKLIHLVLHTAGIDRNKNQCRLKISIEQYNSDMQKYYHHSLFVLKNGSYHKLKQITAKLPPQEIIKAYEKRKKEFTSTLNKDILKSLEKIEQENEPEKHDTRKPLTDKQQEALLVLAKYDGDVKKVVANTHFLRDIIYFHQAAARKKGYTWQEFKEMVQKEAISLENGSFKQ